ncbi:MAG TPA: zf-HC2 domain-containing protein [Candidatus Binatia bacterium]|nr:zf-HC2 domain-containing protein [Candidatus Binatia bacterium]
MSCRAMRERVQAYADDELTVEGAIEVEAHLERCASCRDDFERQRSLRAVVSELYPRPAPPEDLEQRVTAGLREPRRAWRPLVVSAVAAAGLGVVLVWALGPRSERNLPPEIWAALGVHRAAARGTLPPGLASSDVPEVNRWLHGAVPSFPGVPEAESRGFTVRGAAVVKLGGERAAYVLYQAGARPVSLFVLPHRDWPPMGRAARSGDMEFRSLELGGERIVAWSHDPVSYLLVSDAMRAPAEACGVCHSNAEAPGTGDLSVGTPHGGSAS